MADIFISYASEDRGRAEILAIKLQEQGWSVWWDRDLPFGRPFDEVIHYIPLHGRRCLWRQLIDKAHGGINCLFLNRHTNGPCNGEHLPNRCQQQLELQSFAGRF